MLPAVAAQKAREAVPAQPDPVLASGCERN
jgi:hypothetical protein